MPPTASISRTHSQCQRWGRTPSPRPKPRRSGLHAWKCPRRAKRRWSWWSQSGSNRRPQACKASALPTELWPRHAVVGRGGVEPPTSRLSGVRSNHLSYRPLPEPGNLIPPLGNLNCGSACVSAALRILKTFTEAKCGDAIGRTHGTTSVYLEARSAFAAPNHHQHTVSWELRTSSS